MGGWCARYDKFKEIRPVLMGSIRSDLKRAVSYMEIGPFRMLLG